MTEPIKHWTLETRDILAIAQALAGLPLSSAEISISKPTLTLSVKIKK